MTCQSSHSQETCNRDSDQICLTSNLCNVCLQPASFPVSDLAPGQLSSARTYSQTSTSLIPIQPPPFACCNCPAPKARGCHGHITSSRERANLSPLVPTKRPLVLQLQSHTFAKSNGSVPHSWRYLVVHKVQLCLSQTLQHLLNQHLLYSWRTRPATKSPLSGNLTRTEAQVVPWKMNAIWKTRTKVQELLLPQITQHSPPPERFSFSAKKKKEDNKLQMRK